MTAPDPDKRALAAGFVTSTLSEAEACEAGALMESDPEFAALVAAFRDRLNKEGGDPLPEIVWRGIEKHLTGRNH